MNQAFVDLLCKAKLRHLSLADCKLEARTIKALGEGLQTNQFLESLNLRLNTLSAPFFLDFCQCLKPNPTSKTQVPLQKLDLSQTYLSDQSCVTLAKCLLKMPTIEYINLKGNAIDSQGAEQMLVLARENPSVVKINLELNILK